MAEVGRAETTHARVTPSGAMAVDPWEDENEEATHSGRDEDLERESRSRREQVSRRPPPEPPHTNHETKCIRAETAAVRRDPMSDASHSRSSPQFWSEGYREGIEEGKKATVQEGFNVGFREGASAGMAYGQVRGAAVSVGIFAGQTPGSGGWTEAVVGASGMISRMKPVDAVREAKADHARVMRTELNDGDPGTPTRNLAGEPEPSKASDPDEGGKTPPKRARGETHTDGTFAGKMRGARDEIEAAGFELRDVELR